MYTVFMQELLQKLGLSDKEAATYLALLQLGTASVQDVATKTGIKRVTVYVILERLSKLGLLKEAPEGKRSYFRAEHPAVLEQLVDTHIAELEAHRSDLKANITQLEAMYNFRSDKPVVRFFEGKDGLVELENYGSDQMTSDTEMLTISPLDIVVETFPQQRKQTVNTRVERGIHSKVIYVSKEMLTEAQNKKELREAIHFLPGELLLEGSLTVFTDWGIKFFNYTNKNHFGVLIQSPEIANTVAQIFSLAWDGAKLRKEK